MDLFQTNIDGPYALLLVLQILVVSGLLLTLLWLFIYRSKELQSGEGTLVSGATDAFPNPPEEQKSNKAATGASFSGADAPVVLAAGGDGLMDLTSATMGEYSGNLSAQGLFETDQQNAPGAAAISPAPGEGIVEMQSLSSSTPTPERVAQDVAQTAVRPDQALLDAELLHNARAESEELRGKIEYLEGKLLEYEIVQEEIANLSTLKMENEKLREELVQMQRTQKFSSPSAGATSVAVPSVGNVTSDTQGAVMSDMSLSASQKDTTLMMPGAFGEGARDNSEPALAMGTSNLSSELPPEPLPNNVVPLPLGDREPTGKLKPVGEALHDPMIDNQIERILSKLEQLTSKS